MTSTLTNCSSAHHAGIPANQLRQILAAARSSGCRTEPFSSGDGAEWLGWRQNFTIKAAINGWDNRRQHRGITVAMTGAAKQYVTDIPVGDGLPAGLAAGATIPDAKDATYSPPQLVRAALPLGRCLPHRQGQFSPGLPEGGLTNPHLVLPPATPPLEGLPQHAGGRPGDQYRPD